MILFRIVFTVTAILLSRDAFAEPGMWIGTAPFCFGSPADCTDLGMTYVKSDSKGAGGECWTGTKVYCSGHPAPEIAFMGYDACDGLQCHRTMCGSNPGPGPRVIASESRYFCPVCPSANVKRMVRLNKVPSAQIARACPWRYFYVRDHRAVRRRSQRTWSPACRRQQSHRSARPSPLPARQTLGLRCWRATWSLLSQAVGRDGSPPPSAL